MDVLRLAAVVARQYFSLEEEKEEDEEEEEEEGGGKFALHRSSVPAHCKRPPSSVLLAS